MKEKLLFMIKRIHGLEYIYILGSLSIIIDFLISIFYPYLLQEIIDQLNTPLFSPDDFKNLCIIFLAFNIIQMILGIITVFFYRIIRRKVIIDLEGNIVENVENISGNNINIIHSGFIASIISEDVEVLAVAFSDFFIKLIVNFLQIFVVAFILIKINIRIAFIIFLGTYIYILFNFFFSKKIEENTIVYKKYSDDKNTIVQEYINKYITLIKLNCNDYFKKKIIGKEHEVQNVKMKTFLLSASNVYVGSFIRGVLVLIVCFVCSFNIVKEDMTLGELSAVIMYTGYFATPILSLAEAMVDLKEIKVSFDRIFEFLCITDSCEKQDTLRLEKIEKIEFDHVTFHYENDELLKDLCFSINKGEIIAIVGENGTGKSTIINLLCGFLRAQAGKIYLNDKDITNYAVKDIRNRISILTQDKCIFEDTILNNLTMNQICDENQIAELCDVLGIKDYIESQPQKINSRINNNGNNLSEGQKQKLSIIRTFIKLSDLVVLDEATSNIDNITEERFVKEIRNLSKGKMMIIISHRVPILKEVDKVYVLCEGRFLVCGNHEDLIKKSEYYRKKICTEG